HSSLLFIAVFFIAVVAAHKRTVRAFLKEQNSKAVILQLTKQIIIDRPNQDDVSASFEYRPEFFSNLHIDALAQPPTTLSLILEDLETGKIKSLSNWPMIHHRSFDLTRAFATDARCRLLLNFRNPGGQAQGMINELAIYQYQKLVSLPLFPALLVGC